MSRSYIWNNDDEGARMTRLEEIRDTMNKKELRSPAPRHRLDRLVEVHRGWCNFCKGNAEACESATVPCSLRDYIASLPAEKGAISPPVEETATDYKALYYSLIMEVGNKYPGETRYQTALRYLKQAEDSPSSVGCDSRMKGGE